MPFIFLVRHPGFNSSEDLEKIQKILQVIRLPEPQYLPQSESIALRGMLSNFAVAGSCTITIPFFSLIARIPRLPSEPMPERMRAYCLVLYSPRQASGGKNQPEVVNPLVSIGGEKSEVPHSI